SPPLARIMADNVLAALSEIDPENARTYAANHASLVRDIEALDRDIRAIFAGVDPAKRRFMVFHPAWGYFAEAYGLTQIPIQAEGKEPGPRTLARLISEAKNLGVRVIFVQPEFSERSAEVIARAIGGRVQAADPLAPDWLENLKQVAGAFRSALR
ncbi:MAG: zinc ABC transporter substrate-binding protein, partial [Desulfovibrionaceae bacterium]|nr:zinc ABC transporter substrate-binding protein [Desulfovibrionaceae bacterium]